MTTIKPYAVPFVGIPPNAKPGKPVVTVGAGGLVTVGEWPDYSLDATDKTWTIYGPIAVPSGATNYINGWFAPVPPGQALGIVGVWGIIRGGTSVTVEFQKNGTNITGLTSISVTTTKSFTSLSNPLAIGDGDYIAPVVTAVSGSPDNMVLGLFFTRQLTP